MKALKGQSIILYTPQDLYEDKGGFFLPSQEKLRDNLRKVGKKNLNDPPPDIIRKGVVISGDFEGMIVFFNKHDAQHFTYNEQEYYRVSSKWISALEEH